jgi:hypothetical protein
MIIQKEGRGFGNNLKTKQIKAHRASFVKSFPNANNILDIHSYDGVDQGEEGACLFAAAINLIHICGRNDLHPRTVRDSWKKIKHKNYWEKLYGACMEATEKPHETPPSCALDYDGFLQVGKDIPFIAAMSKDPDWTYIPIRGYVFRENRFNKDLIINGANEKSKNKLINVLLKFQALIDEGIPIAVSWNGHARVIVGYNEKEFLFADSWGRKHWEKTKVGTMPDVIDFNRAGFSTVDKYFVSAFARDFMYFKKKHDDD